MFDTNQDLEQAGSQSAFGQPITNGVTGGTTKNDPTCTGGVGVSASGGLGDAWTMNTANPLPTPTDSNPSAALGDLPSSNLDLTSATSRCRGRLLGRYQHPGLDQHHHLRRRIDGPHDAAQLLGRTAGTAPTAASGPTRPAATPTPRALQRQPTGDAACPPDQADVNAGYVSCGVIVSSGNDENGSTNYSTMDLFFNGQPVPQTPTATLSAAGAQPGDTVSRDRRHQLVGQRPTGPPTPNPTGDFQNSAADFYPVERPAGLHRHHAGPPPCRWPTRR